MSTVREAAQTVRRRALAGHYESLPCRQAPSRGSPRREARQRLIVQGAGAVVVTMIIGFLSVVVTQL